MSQYDGKSPAEERRDAVRTRVTNKKRNSLHAPSDKYEPPDLSNSRYYAMFDQSILDNDLGGGLGTYTGVASEDIVFPPAIAHYLLVEIGELTSGDITTGAATFGSFSTAITDINALVAGDWEIIARYTETIDVQAALNGLSAQAPVTFWRSQLDNKMKSQVYKTTPATQDYFKDLDSVNYKWKYTEDMIEGSVIVQLTPPSDIVNEIHIRHGLYAPSNQYTKDAMVGPLVADDGTGGGSQTRKTQAASSESYFRVKNTIIIEADHIYLSVIATKLRDMLFDRFQRPRILLQFDTWGRATTMDINMNTLVHNELQNYIPVPKYNYTGTAVEWDELIFYVRSKRIFNDNGRIRHRIMLEEVPQPL